MNVSWNYIAARGDHIIAEGAYEIMYGPNWRDIEHAPPTPKFFHVEDCPGCWFDQWRGGEDE